MGVEQRIDEAQWALASSDELIIDKRDSASKDWGSTRRPIDSSSKSAHKDFDLHCLCCDVWKATAAGIKLASVGGANALQITRDDRRLVGRRLEDVGKPSTRE